MNEIKPGLSFSITRKVQEKDTATAFGSGDVEVFATPAMIALMEETALKSVQPFLAADQTTVGFEVDIRHFKAVRVGAEVISKSEVREVKGRKLLFEVEVLHQGESVGKGSHTRYIVERKDFT
jgi:predicted thioesterase